MILLLCFCASSVAQKGAEFEQYFSHEPSVGVSYSGLANFQSRKGLYIEGRYNYEASNTFSVYGGKSFSGGTDRFNYTITPALGVIFGKMTGGSFAINADLEYRSFFIESRSQYSFSVSDSKDKFIYSWSELGINVTDFAYGGVSIQVTRPFQNRSLIEPGVFVGFSVGQFDFPVYYFRSMGDSYLLFCVCVQLQTRKK